MATSAKTLKHNQRAPTTPRLASSSIINGLESSLSTDSQMSAKITAPAALNIPGDDVTSSRSMTAAVSEKSATMKSSTALNKTTDVKESLYPGQRVQLSTLTLTTLGTAASRTTISGTQEGETIGAPHPSMVSTLSETHHGSATRTPSGPVESAPGALTAAAQSPETAAAHLIALIPSSSGTTQPSDRTGSSQASPKPTQSSSPGARACAPDKYPAEGGVADNSYYAYSKLSLVLVALHCQPQTIEVVLSSCFLKTYRWILREGTFSGCPSVSKIEEDHRVQVFVLETKEDQPLFSGDASSAGSPCLHQYCLHNAQLQSNPEVFPYATIPVLCTGDVIIILGIFMDPQLSSVLENRPFPLGKRLYMVFGVISIDPDRFAPVANEAFAR
ncbi:hypothetical protein PRBEI_2000854000 [Prionailurus iriomotensis]